MNVYLEMLSELDLPVHIPVESSCTVYNEKCKYCGQFMEEWASFEYGCWDCGLVSRLPVFEIAEQDYSNERTCFGKILPKGNFYCVKILGGKSQMNIVKRRGYNPLTHFREHLRRYMGYRFSEDPLTKELRKYPEDLIQLIVEEVDLHRADAYFEVKKVLKKYKKRHSYNKDIFQIIYEAGGKRPQISHQLFEKCVRRFMNFQYHFNRIREEYKRHNMPCFYMILELILKEFDHEPFYQFPHLKDDVLKERIYEIFKDVNKKSNAF